MNTKFIVRTGIFSAISILLYCVPIFHFSIPLFPSFLEIHLDEIPCLIAGFAYGPLSGFITILIKTIVKLPLSTTLCAGELADLIYSSVFVITSSLIYKKKRNIKGVIIGLSIATLLQLIVSCLFTTFVMLDVYSSIYGLPLDAILNMCQAINPNITSLSWPFLFMVALPFNAIKDGLVIAVTFILYKRLHTLIDKI